MVFETHLRISNYKFVIKEVGASLKLNIFCFLSGFQLEFVSCISRVINHMTCYNSSALIGGKSFKKYPLQCSLSRLNAVVSTNEST